MVNNELIHWVRANKLSLNVMFTEITLYIYLLTASIFLYFSNCKFVGLPVDEKFNWSYLIHHICQKNSKSIGELSRLRI